MQDMLGKKMIHARFEYTDGIKRLVRSALLPLLLSRSADESLSILDCGCGVGPWLEFIAGLAPACHQDRLYGFDLTPELVELARQRLADCRLTTLISQGDILNPSRIGSPMAGQATTSSSPSMLFNNSPASSNPSHSGECWNIYLPKVSLLSLTTIQPLSLVCGWQSKSGLPGIFIFRWCPVPIWSLATHGLGK